MQQDYEAFNLDQALSVLRRRGLLIVLCFIVVTGAAFGYSKHETKMYTATASLAFSTNQLSEQIAGLSANSSGNLSVQEASNLELVKLGDMAAKTATALGHGLTEEKVADSVSVAAQGESSIVDVSATLSSPELAAKIVNTYTHQFVTEQTSSNHKYFESALALVHKQLSALSSEQRVGPDGLELQDRAQTLGLLADLQYGDVQVAQEASIPASPSSPKVSRNTVLGGLIGLLIGIGLALVLERLDRRIRRPEDLESTYGFPLLGVVPRSAALSHSAKRNGGKRVTLPPADAEAFNLIRAHLRFFNEDHDLHSVVIASAEPGDGKTTIACHLAEAAARVGDRVLLVEADLRQPNLAQLLDIKPGPGLADLLTGTISMADAITSIALQGRSGDDTKALSFDVLPAGSTLPSSPAKLIESATMEATIAQAKSKYELVVIDTPPLTVVSDAFPLLTKVDGVVLVSWAGRSRLDAAEQLRKVIASSTPRVLGVIANGAKSGRRSPYIRANDHDSSRAITSATGVELPDNELAPAPKA